jgi:hypothetical protein
MDNGGNGELKKEKTPEELNAEKIAEFNKDPDMFVDLRELIFATKRSEKGIQVYINNATRQELMISRAEADYMLHQAVIQLELDRMRMMATEKKIVTGNPVVPKHGIMDFARRK